MSIEKDLKKDGIQVIKEVDTLSVTLIAKFVAERLSSTFLFYGLKYNDLFIKISRIPMYIATMPDGMAEANYFYKNSSIYFKEGLSLEEMQTYAIHEFIHHLQELKDKKNVLYRLGLCDFTNFKVYGMGLNEAAVQYLASKALKNEVETVKYYGITFSSNSPNCYPLLCNLMSQIVYLVGEPLLVDSTLGSNDKLKAKLIYLLGERNFYTIQDNFDKILYAEEKIVQYSNKVKDDSLSEKQIVKYAYGIGSSKKKITDTYIATQKLILSSYFEHYLENIHSAYEIETFRKQLYGYKDYIGTLQDDTFFNTFYIDAMAKLEEKEAELTGTTANLVPYKRNFFSILWQKCTALWKGRETENEKI